MIKQECIGIPDMILLLMIFCFKKIKIKAEIVLSPGGAYFFGINIYFVFHYTSCPIPKTVCHCSYPASISHVRLSGRTEIFLSGAPLHWMQITLFRPQRKSEYFVELFLEFPFLEGFFNKNPCKNFCFNNLQKLFIFIFFIQFANPSKRCF